MRRRDVLGFASAAAAASLAPRLALAQPAWPSSNITIVVPFTPGGLTDILARSVGDKIAPVLGRPVIVDNRPGAGGAIGATAVARSAPDGHTLLLGHIGILAVNPSLYANLQYDPLAFAYVAPLAIVPNVIVVNPSVPVHSIQELIDYATANPGKLNFSTRRHRRRRAHRDGRVQRRLRHHHDARAVSRHAAIGRRRHFRPGPAHVHQRRIAVAARACRYAARARRLDPNRLSIAPDIPAIAETLPGFDLSAWYGIVGPAGLPEPIVRRLHDEVRKAMAAPDIGRRLNTEGAVHWDVSPRNSAVTSRRKPRAGRP